MVRHFESFNGTMSVSIDDAGFAVVDVIHQTCGTRTSYASGPLSPEHEEIVCDRCGILLLRLTVSEYEKVSDTGELL